MARGSSPSVNFSLCSLSSDIEKVFGTNRGNGILNTSILMVKTTIYKYRQKEELHTLMILSITFIRRWHMSIIQRFIRKLTNLLGNGEIFV